MKSEAKRFLSIRLSQDEFEKVRHHLQQSTCRSLTEYVRKALTNQPLTVKVRDQAREDILHELGVIKSLLKRLPVPGATVEANVLNLIREMNLTFREIAKKCSQ